MSMGYGAGYADVISLNKVKQVCPVEYKAFFKELKVSKVKLDSFAQFIDTSCELDLAHIEDEDQAVATQEKLTELYEALQTAFHKKSGGLQLNLGFHDSDNEGDTYDEVNGAYFCVGGMYQLTPAGKKFNRSVKRKFFVTYG